MSRNIPAIFRQLSKPLALSLLTLSLLALSGCGQKGPLYMPGDSESAETYDPQNAHEDSPGTNAGSDDEQQRADDTPQATPAPAAPQPNAEELP